MQSQIANYKKEGFLHLPDFFQTNLIEQIRLEALDIFKTQLLRLKLISKNCSELEFEAALYQLFELDLATYMNCGKQIQHLINLHQLSLNSKLLKYINDLGLNKPVISTRPVLFFNSKYLAKKESYWKTPPHQDWKSIQGSINSIVVWVPLVDIDVKLGAVEVIPKSHKLGLMFDETIDGFGAVNKEFWQDDLYVPLEVKQGDVVIFSQFLIHRSGKNTTENIRWSCHFRYNDLDEETFINRGFPHNYIYQPKDEIINPDFNTKKHIEKYFKDEDDRS